ncbi:hypothetical protein MMYC01_201957 [Madurella mycetomatis]|uniref:Uncharacterized protein n=1 Tax=Madurella mycetomatis TaxID=100816 RepID=A0A175WFM4_9PEZI|nr:hypothetical protein MMYC01_201957 [Madurella mycetomatis]
MERPNTNPDEIDLDDDDFYGDDGNTAELEDVLGPTMAATMGFTSFGGSRKRGNGDPASVHSTKKRRFNHQPDEAVIAEYEDPDNFYDQGKGHDSALEIDEPEPLQQPGIITASKAQLASKTKRKTKPKDDDPDYIDYSDDGDNSNGDNDAAAADYDNLELDTTLDSDAPSPTRTPIVAAAEEAAAGAPPPPPPPPQPKPGKKAPAQSIGASKSQPQSQTPAGKTTKRAGAPPASKWGGKQPQGQGSGQGQTQARPQGQGRTQIDLNWYVDYYVAGSNENPWEKLEAERGIKAVGSWITRAAGPGGGNGNGNGNGN